MSGTELADFSFSLDLPVRNEWKNVELLRSSVENCFQAVFSDMDGCAALSMVTGELLENALKYGDWETPAAENKFRLRVDGARPSTLVTVQNPVRIGDPGLDGLLETIRWIKSFKTPAEAYRARLLEIASSEGDIDNSKLGLVRVAYEGNCDLDARIDATTLTVTATMRMA